MSSVLKRTVGATAAIGLAVVGLQLIGVGVASAHTNTVTGSATCQQDGTYTVDWSVTNTYTTDETATITGHAPAGSAVSPTTLDLPAGASGSVTHTAVPGTATTATLGVHGVWKPDSFAVDVTGSVSLDGTCGTKPTAVPTAPTAANGACVDNATTSPSIVIPSRQDVTYRLDGRTVAAGKQTVNPGTHTVTAESTVLKLTGRTTWTYHLTTASGDCAVTPVSPVVPGTSQSRCTGTGPSAPALTVPRTTGITYTVSTSAPYGAGDTVTVTATTKSGHVLGTVPSGWTKTSSTRASYLVTFAGAPACSGTEGDTDHHSGGTNGSGGALANTGSHTGALVGAGLALLLLGSLLTVQGRRRVTA